MSVSWPNWSFGKELLWFLISGHLQSDRFWSLPLTLTLFSIILPSLCSFIRIQQPLTEPQMNAPLCLPVCLSDPPLVFDSSDRNKQQEKTTKIAPPLLVLLLRGSRYLVIQDFRVLLAKRCWGYCLQRLRVTSNNFILFLLIRKNSFIKDTWQRCEYSPTMWRMTKCNWI